MSTRLNSHQVGQNGDRTLGQCDSSNARSEVFSEAAGCFSGTYAGLEEKEVFEGFARVPRAEPMKKMEASYRKRQGPDRSHD